MMILLTGGSKCGKSTLAEWLVTQLAGGNGAVTYVATMQAVDRDDFSIVTRHQEMRKGKGFHVIEQCRGLNRIDLPQGSVALLEDVPNLLANEIFGGDGPAAALEGITHLQALSSHLVVVTNEVGSDGILYADETLAYVDALGLLNQELAHKADAVVEVMCGIPNVLKGALP